jgi:hypothetical protein
VWLTVLPLLMIFCGWYRWSVGLHFQEVFVRLGESFADRGCTVYGVVSSGRLVQFRPAAAIDRLWVFPFVNSVRSLVVTTPDGREVVGDDFDGEVKVGSAWPDAQSLALSDQRWVTEEDPEFGESLRRLGLTGGMLVRPFATAMSRSNVVTGAINWGGDWNFVSVSAVQGLLIWLVLSAILWGLTRILSGRAAVTETAGVVGGWMSIAAQTLRLLLLVLTVHQCWVAIQSLLWVRSPAGFLGGVALFLLLMALYFAWLRWVWVSQSSRAVIVKMLAAGLLLLAVKLYWLRTVDYRPSSDYLLFHRLGQQLAAGDWEGISATKRRFALTYVHRAWCYSYPVSALFGAEITTFEYVNVGYQALSLVVFCLLVSRVSGLTTAAACMPLGVVYSEFWYSTGMVAPNVAAYFWIPLSWLLVDVFDRMLSGPPGSGEAGICRSWLAAASLGVATGCCIGIVDLLKRYSPFFLLALMLFTVFRRWFSSGDVISRFSARVLFLLMVVVTSLTLSSGVSTKLSTRSGLPRTDPNFALALLAHLETDSTALGKAFHHWIYGFFHNVPESRQRELQIRKILHEQVAGGANVYSQVLLKNRVMAHPTNAMVQVLDNISPVAFGRMLMYVPQAAFQVTLAWQISLSMIVAGVLRLLVIRLCPLNPREVFPLLSAVATLAAGYLLTEGHPYTGQNSAFPLIWTVGILVQTLLRPVAVTGLTVGSERRMRDVLTPGPLAIAAVFLCCLALLHVGLGRIVERAGLTFHRISPVASGSEQTSGLSEAEVGLVQSRVHAGLKLLPQDSQLKAGDLAERQFVVESTAPLRGVRFFITGNVRKFVPDDRENFRAILAAGWKGLPIEYEVLLGGKLVSRGPLESLAFSRFAEYPAEFWLGDDRGQPRTPNSVVMTLRLRCVGDVNTRNVVWPPSLAVEFFH